MANNGPLPSGMLRKEFFLARLPRPAMNADALARRTDDPHKLGDELETLEVEARAWFDPFDDDTGAALERLGRVLITTSQVALDLARPDSMNLRMLRDVARAPAAWDDPQLLAAVALAALGVAGDGLDDEGYALRYLGAARDALRLAELMDAPRAHQATQTATAADAKRRAHAADLERFAAAWQAFPSGDKFAAKLAALAPRFSKAEKTLETWHAEARALGLLA